MVIKEYNISGDAETALWEQFPSGILVGAFHVSSLLGCARYKNCCCFPNIKVPNSILWLTFVSFAISGRCYIPVKHYSFMVPKCQKDLEWLSPSHLKTRSVAIHLEENCSATAETELILMYMMNVPPNLAAGDSLNINISSLISSQLIISKGKGFMTFSFLLNTMGQNLSSFFEQRHLNPDLACKLLGWDSKISWKQKNR